jgi:hypothetical protein
LFIFYHKSPTDPLRQFKHLQFEPDLDLLATVLISNLP